MPAGPRYFSSIMSSIMRSISSAPSSPSFVASSHPSSWPCPRGSFSPSSCSSSVVEIPYLTSGFYSAVRLYYTVGIGALVDFEKNTLYPNFGDHLNPHHSPIVIPVDPFLIGPSRVKFCFNHMGIPKRIPWCGLLIDRIPSRVVLRFPFEFELQSLITFLNSY